MGLVTTPVRLILRRLGLDVDRHSRSYESRRQRIFDRRGVTLVIDVGANAGQYARELRNEGFRGRILSVEPVSDTYSVLLRRCNKDPLWDCVNIALGSDEGTCTMNVSKNRVSSSVLPMSALHVEASPSSEYQSSERVRMRTLDDLVSQKQLVDEVIAVKLDVQGYEQQVLVGGQQVLAVASFVEMEISMTELYEGQAGLREMLEYMNAHGFHAIAVQPGFRHPGTDETLQVDVLFAQDLSLGRQRESDMSVCRDTGRA